MPEGATLEQLAERAFRIIDLRRERKTVSAIKRQPEASESEEDEINAVNRFQKGPRGQGGRKPRNSGPGSGDGQPFVCFAHKKFGPKAYSCKPGCSFAELPSAQRGAGNGPAGR